MKTSWLKLVMTTALLTSPVVNAKISQWSLGVAASYSPAVYKDTPSNETVIPLVGYEGERLFLRGFSAGYRWFPAGSSQNIIFRVAYDPRTLKPSDSDNRAIQQMDQRKATVLGGVSYQLITLAGVLEATAGTDLAGRHNGLYAEAAWRLPFRQKGWGVTPSIGYAYNSDKINDHLYGVSEAEAARAQIYDTTFRAFEADWDGQYFIGVSAYVHITPSVRFTGGVRYTNLEGAIESSPLIESGVSTSANIGIAYVF